MVRFQDAVAVFDDLLAQSDGALKLAIVRVCEGKVAARHERVLVVAAQDARAVVEDLLEKINSLAGVALPVVGVCEVVA